MSSDFKPWAHFSLGRVLVDYWAENVLNEKFLDLKF